MLGGWPSPVWWLCCALWLHAGGSGVRFCDGLKLGLFILDGWDQGSFVCCLVHRSSADDHLLLRISTCVVWRAEDLPLSRSTLYLLSPRFCFFIVLIRGLFVCRGGSFEGRANRATG